MYYIRIYEDDENFRSVSISESSLKLVRQSFNPSGQTDVDVIKVLAAALVSQCEAAGKDGRLTSIARSAAEKAAMYGVKSATADL